MKVWLLSLTVLSLVKWLPVLIYLIYSDCVCFSFADMRTASLLFLLSFLLAVSDSQAGSEFRICAFNLHHFGESKAKKSDVMLTLARVGIFYSFHWKMFKTLLLVFFGFWHFKMDCFSYMCKFSWFYCIFEIWNSWSRLKILLSCGRSFSKILLVLLPLGRQNLWIQRKTSPLSWQRKSKGSLVVNLRSRTEPSGCLSLEVFRACPTEKTQNSLEGFYILSGLGPSCGPHR